MEARRSGAVMAVVAAAMAVVALLVASTWYTCGFRGCPDVNKLRAYIPEQASVVLDRRGSEIAKLYRVNRRIMPLDSLPSYVPAAFVAVEDKRFYQHHGVDWVRVPGAVVADVRRKGFAQGFSTITMQLARNLFPDRLPAAEKSPLRKLSEMRVATKIESRYSKQDILQMYLNQIYFGHGAWGIEAAAQEYFGKSARELTLPEAATLAGLPQSPSRANPRSDRDAATERRDVVLADMAKQGFITAAQAEAAQRTKIHLRRGRPDESIQQAPYFLEEVRNVLESQLGDAIYTQGLVIHTTLDLPTQRVAEQELERQLESIERGAYGGFNHPRYDPRTARSDTTEPAYLQGALMMLDSQTGDVLAYIGGRNFAQSRYDRVTQAKRQPGSAFKPFVYTAAVAAGYPPTYTLMDEPLVVPVSRGKTWSPQNYEGDFKGPIPMMEALAESRNVPTVRLANQVGADKVIETAHQMGVNEQIPYVPSMPLGVVSVTPWELIDAYTAFSALGNRAQPRLVTEVQDRDGNTVWGEQPQAQQTVDPAVAFVMTSMLKGVVDHGTGTPVRAAGYRGPAAGKTGTTQSGTDAWFIGFTPRVTMGIWVGFDRPTPISGNATGGVLAGPAWGRIMARTAAPTGDWAPPAGVDKLWVEGNAVLAADCPPPPGAMPMYFVSGTAPATAGCQPAGNFAQVDSAGMGGTDTTGMTTSVDSVSSNPGWWNRLRTRIFGHADSAAAMGATPPGGTQPLPGRPTRVPRPSDGSPPPDQEPATDTAAPPPPPPPSSLPGRALPRRPGDGAPKARPRPAPPGGEPAQPAPPPPDTGGVASR